MIKCNIEVNEYTKDSFGKEEFSFSYTKYVLNFPVLPPVATIINIKDTSDINYEVLRIDYRAVVRDRHDCHENIANVEIYIIVREV